MAALAALALLASDGVAAQDEVRVGMVFALIDSNEWCPGGSVYVDLEAGTYVLYPRIGRRECYDTQVRPDVERGTVSGEDLRVMQAAYLNAARAGLERDECDIVVSNGGPEVVVMTGPGFSATTPGREGCWSEEAKALHRELFRIFGEQRQAHSSAP